MGKKRGRDRSSKEETNVDFTGPSCSHIRKGIDHGMFKRNAADVDWDSCQDCKEGKRTLEENDTDAESSGDPQVIWICLKCGHRGCGRYSEEQHAIKHYEKPRSDPHCLVLNLDNWSVWCYICDDDVQYSSTGQLAQLVANIKRHALANGDRKASKAKDVIINPEEKLVVEEEIADQEKERKERQKKTAVKDTESNEKSAETHGSTTALSVRGLSNLGNTCFFNAVMQSLSHTHLLRNTLSSVTREKNSITLTPSGNTELEPMEVQLDPPGPLTLAMWQLLIEIQETKKGVVTPRELFTQVCKKAARFKGFQQQDSQELLRYLLDGMRAEEVKRFKSGILEVMKSSGKNVESDETKMLLRNYEKTGALKSFVDQVFGGEMISTVMCKECKTVSMVTEVFLDLSLPVSDEAYRKKNQKKVSQSISVGDDELESPTPLANGNENMPSGAGSKYQQKKAKKQAKKQAKTQRRQQKQEVRVSLNATSGLDEQGDGDAEMTEASTPCDPTNQSEPSATTDKGAQMETDQPSACEEDDSKRSESKMDNQCKGDEGQQQQEENEREDEVEEVLEKDAFTAADDSVVGNRFMALADDQDSVTQTDEGGSSSRKKHAEVLEDGTEERPGGQQDEREELIKEMDRLTLNGTGNVAEDTQEKGAEPEPEQEESLEYMVVHQDPDKAFCTLATRAAPEKQECSVASSLFQFTEVEHLSHSNSLLCVTCTKRQSASNNTQGTKKSVYREALKQMLISSPPPVLTLHLKRFQQVGYSVCKVNRHVQFPQLLDLAPYCSLNCKNVSAGESRILYSLYGIVEHSGTMRSGHYIAYVKARPHSEDLTSSGLVMQGNVEPPKGSWFYVSDSSVQPVTEAKVQTSQAYLLFYERIS